MVLSELRMGLNFNGPCGEAGRLKLQVIGRGREEKGT